MVVRRPTPVLAVLLVPVLLAVVGCSTHRRPVPASTTTSSTRLPSRNDPALQPTLLAATDLPAGLLGGHRAPTTRSRPSAPGRTPWPGLQATARAYIAFTRTPSGVGIVHLVFRFRKGDGTKFVDQAKSILSSCSNVPDIHGLAFTYEASAPAIDAAMAGTDDFVSRHGTSVGRGNLGEDVAMFRRGDLGELVAVLTNTLPRDQTDAMALAAVTAAVRRAPAG